MKNGEENAFTFVLMKENIKEGDGLMASNYVRFDWVMKRLLCNKANFGVLEGFFTTLLNGNCDSEMSAGPGRITASH